MVQINTALAAATATNVLAQRIKHEHFSSNIITNKNCWFLFFYFITQTIIFMAAHKICFSMLKEFINKDIENILICCSEIVQQWVTEKKEKEREEKGFV